MIADAWYGSEKNYERAMMIFVIRMRDCKKAELYTIQVSYHLTEAKKQGNGNICSEKVLNLSTKNVMES